MTARRLKAEELNFSDPFSSGRPAGERGPDGQFPAVSVNAAVEQALAENVARLRLMRGEPPASHAMKGERS